MGIANKKLLESIKENIKSFFDLKMLDFNIMESCVKTKDEYHGKNLYNYRLVFEKATKDGIRVRLLPTYNRLNSEVIEIAL